MRTDLSRLRRPGITAAAAALLVAGVVGSVGVAGARESKTIFSVENGGPCFSLERKATCNPGELGNVTIQTGETVTWDFASGVATQMSHNAVPVDKNTPDADWNGRDPMSWQVGGTSSHRFGKPGVYTYYCFLHSSTMKGTITVEGEPVEVTQTPTPSATQTATPTPSPTATATFQSTPPPGATPVPDDHTTTPAPGKTAAKDSEAPRLLRARVKSATGGAKLSFWVSEPANVEVTVRRGKSVVTSARLHVAAGTRSVVVRSSSLRKKGTYTVEWRAVDAMANKSNVAKKTLKVKR
jgi:plastocyanin